MVSVLLNMLLNLLMGYVTHAFQYELAFLVYIIIGNSLPKYCHVIVGFIAWLLDEFLVLSNFI